MEKRYFMSFFWLLCVKDYHLWVFCIVNLSHMNNQGGAEKKGTLFSRYRLVTAGIILWGLAVSGILYATVGFLSLPPKPSATETENGSFYTRLKNIWVSCTPGSFVKGFDASYNPVCVPYNTPNSSSANANLVTFAIPLSEGLPGGKFGTYFNNISGACSNNAVLKGLTLDGKKICVDYKDRTTFIDNPSNVTILPWKPAPSWLETWGNFQTFFSNMFTSCGTDEWVTGFMANGTPICARIPVDGRWSDYGACSATCGPGTKTKSCNNPAPADGGASCTGDGTADCNLGACPNACVPDNSCADNICATDSCLNTCNVRINGTKTDGVCGWSCIPDNSCDAAVPACNQTTSGLDNCGNACEKIGNVCATSGGSIWWVAYASCEDFEASLKPAGDWKAKDIAVRMYMYGLSTTTPPPPWMKKKGAFLIHHWYQNGSWESIDPVIKATMDQENLEAFKDYCEQY